MPAARAIATRCSVWLVEPPLASSATQALTIAFSSTISPIGVGSPPWRVIATARSAAARVSASRSGVPGLTNDEPGQVQAEHLHQQLVGVGGAVERARALRVVRRRLGLEQLLAADLALGVQLAHPGLLAVGQARGHRPGRHEDGRQVAERQRADQQPGHDLVADAEHQRAVEHVVAERDRGRHRDHVAAVERELHAVAALGDAVAHRGHAARDLGDAAGPDHGLLEHRRVVAVGLVGREHVVVAGDDRQVGLGAPAQRRLVVGLGGGEAVGEVGAGQPAARRARGRRRPGCGAGRPRGWGRCARRGGAVTSATTGWR